MKLTAKLSIAAVIAILSLSVANAQTPFQFTFFEFNAPVADQVSGVRFPAIYGKGGGDIVGLDFGLLAFSEMKSLRGVAWSVLPTANHITGEMTGISASLLNWHEGQDTGINFGAVNITNNVTGLNWSFVNFSKGYTTADVGAISISQKSNFQLSFVNVTEEIDGIQIGLLNCAKNGFLPCFVFFNFGSSK